MDDDPLDNPHNICQCSSDSDAPLDTLLPPVNTPEEPSDPSEDPSDPTPGGLTTPTEGVYNEYIHYKVLYGNVTTRRYANGFLEQITHLNLRCDSGDHPNPKAAGNYPATTVDPPLYRPGDTPPTPESGSQLDREIPLPQQHFLIRLGHCHVFGDRAGRGQYHLTQFAIPLSAPNTPRERSRERSRSPRR